MVTKLGAVTKLRVLVTVTAFVSRLKSYSCFYRCPSFVYYTGGSDGFTSSSPTGGQVFWRRRKLRDFEIYVTVNEWTDEKAGQYLAVYLKDDAKAFYLQQSETMRKSFSELSKALKQRYEGGLALLKYKRDFNSRSRKEGEPLHSYLADLRMAYDRAHPPPRPL